MSYKIIGETMYEDFKEQFPLVAQQVVEYTVSDRMELTLWLTERRKAIYNCLTHSIRYMKCRQGCDEEPVPNEEDWKRDFATMLGKKMRSNNVSQKELAELTGISQQLLSKYMNAKAAPGAYNLMLISNALGCSASELTVFDF